MPYRCDCGQFLQDHQDRIFHRASCVDALLKENEALRSRLAELEGVLMAMRNVLISELEDTRKLLEKK